MKVELRQFFSLQRVVNDYFPTRSTRWVRDAFKDGRYGPVLRDGGGWLVSAEALAGYQSAHAVGNVVVNLRPEQQANLKQNRAA